MDQLQQYESYQTWQPGNQRGDGSFTVRVKPAIQRVTSYLIQGTSTQAVEKAFSPKLSTNSTQVPHYGLKLSFDPMVQGSSATPVPIGYLSMQITYHMKMYHSR